MKYFKFKNQELLNPILIVIKKLGGSANTDEIEEQIIQHLNLSDEQVNEIHRGSRTKLNYTLGWAKNILKNYDLLENSSRGIWSLTEKGKNVDTVDEKNVMQTVFEKNIKKKYGISYLEENNNSLEEDEEEIKWEDELLEIIKKISPDAFERLCQRVLRELGFVDVKVTGKVGDGGIDGSGVIKINGTLSFNVVFQAKRYAGSVSLSVIRDFRGAMIGRADKGLIITTVTFTRDALTESRRDRSPNIDLVDGVDLVKKLKYLKLGIEITHIEKITINKDWFEKI
jgi:restriction system protein